MKSDTTYIERRKYYEANRVFIFKRVNGENVTGQMVYLDTWKRNSTQIKLVDFKRRFELCPVQIR